MANVIVTNTSSELSGKQLITADGSQTLTNKTLTAPTINAAVLSGILSGTPTFSGVFNNTAFGTHLITTGTAGAQNLKVENTTSGTTTQAKISLSAGTTNTVLSSTSQGWTTSGPYKLSTTFLDGDGAGGISLSASNAAGVISFWTGGANLRWSVDAAGNFAVGSSSHLALSNGTPGISVTGGTTSSVSGFDYAFLAAGAGNGGGGAGPTQATITFGHTFSTIPVVVAMAGTAATTGVTIASISTTQVVINFVNAGAGGGYSWSVNAVVMGY